MDLQTLQIVHFNFKVQLYLNNKKQITICYLCFHHSSLCSHEFINYQCSITQYKFFFALKTITKPNNKSSGAHKLLIILPVLNCGGQTKLKFFFVCAHYQLVAHVISKEQRNMSSHIYTRKDKKISHLRCTRVQQFVVEFLCMIKFHQI